MMFGEKSRQIKDLQEQLAALKVDPENDALAALAKGIRDDITQLTTDPGMDIDKALSIAQANATEHTKRQMLTEYIAAMPPNEVFRAYAEQIGDEQVLAILASRALRGYEEQKVQLLLEDLQEEAARSLRLDLSRLPIGAMVEIAFFYKSDTLDIHKSSFYQDDAVRMIKGRTENPKTPNKLTIYEDKSKFASIRNEAFRENQVVEIGSFMSNEEGERLFVPIVTHGMEASFQSKDVQYNFPYDVGYVIVNDTVVLDTPHTLRMLINQH
jgi:hypothetical protein